jgi:hypothetical protein
MRDWWTIGRASGIGGSAGLVALLLWVPQRAFDALTWPLAVAAGLGGLCGTSILLITTADLLFHRRRGARLRPLRVFDVVLGLFLVALCLVQLDGLAGQLGPLW